MDLKVWGWRGRRGDGLKNDPRVIKMERREGRWPQNDPKDTEMTPRSTPKPLR